VVIFVDPSGRGKDETAWAVMKVLNGILYLLKVGHEVADPTNRRPVNATDRLLNVVILAPPNLLILQPPFCSGYLQ
jgi:hypothetical protein